MKKRLFATLLALVMALGLTATVWADDPVTYVDENGVEQTLTDTYTTVTSSSSTVTWGEAGKTKWYVVNENVDINNYVTVNGDVKLILMDGKRLEVKGGLVGLEIGGQIYGIYLESGASLTVYGQSGGTGTLDAPEVGRALYSQDKIKPSRAIGIDLRGGSLTINGGHVKAGVTVNNAAICGLCDGTLNMNGGKLTATSYVSPSASIPIYKITIQSACCKWRTTDSGDYTAGSNIPTEQNQFTPNTRDFRYLEIIAGHEFNTVFQATPATCTTDGNRGHLKCSLCGKETDAAGVEITADENLTIPATGHHFVGRTCSDCGYTKPSTGGSTPTTTPAAPEPETVGSPKTADPGVLLTAALSVVSLLGMGYVGKKR